MTVAQMIQALSKLPQDAEVSIDTFIDTDADKEFRNFDIEHVRSGSSSMIALIPK